MSSWKRRLWKWTAGLFAALVILLATLAGLFRLLTPLVPGYRAQVEAWASAVLQHPVEIHSMSAEWGWHGPEAALEGVRILSRDRKRVIVAAEEARLGLALKSLLHGDLPRPDRVVLVAPRLEIERGLDGRYDIRGLEGSAQKNNTDWHRTLEEAFSESAEIAVRDGQVTLFDARVPNPALFQRINLSIDNSADVHKLKGSVQLPPEFGHGLKFDLAIQGQGLAPAGWDWHGSFQGTGLMLPRWLSYGPDEWQGLFAAGSLDVDASARAQQGALQQADLALGAHDLKRDGAPGPVLGLLQGRFGWLRDASGWKLTGKQLHLQYGQSNWPVSDFDVGHVDGTDGQHWSGSAGFLRLQDLAALAQWMPASLGSHTDEALRRLHGYSPTGEISGLGFKYRWDGKAVQDWSFKAGFKGLGVHASEGWPGFSGMDGNGDVSVAGGQVRLAARNANVDFRPLFRTEMHADTADLVAAVTHDATGWRVAADTFKLENADAAAHGRAAMGFPADGTAPTLDIDATVDRADARGKSTYFPVGIMPKEVVEWLDRSIKAGTVTTGTVNIHGKTSDFPWRDNKGGTFDIQFHIEHGELDYQPGWPAVKDYAADVRFLDQGLTAKVLGGSYNGIAITGGTAQFKELASGVLEVDGSGRGDASHGLDFLRTGPLKETLEGYLDGLSAKGDTDASVHIYLPLTKIEQYKLQGNVTLHQVSVGLTAIPALTAEHLEGDLDFGKYGFATQGLRGTALGGPLNLAIRTPHTDRGSASTVTARGNATAAGLAKLIGYGSERWLTGGTSWQLDGKIPLQAGLGTAGLNLTVRSDLTGLAAALPAPFAKQAADPRQFRLNLKFDEAGDFDYIGSYGNELGLLLAFTPDGKGGLGFDRGELRVGAGTAARPAAPGMEVSGYLPALAWDEWKKVLPPSPAGAEVAPSGTARGADMPRFLRSVDLDVGRLTAFGQDVSQLHLAVQRNDEGWQGQVDSASLAGKFNVPASVDAIHPIVLDMDRADFGKAGAPAATEPAKQAKVSDSAGVNYDPRSIPALRFSSKRLRYGEMALDNVSLALMPQPSGVALEDLKVAAPSFTITGDGTWFVTPAGQQRTTLNADVESTDVEASLRALGYDAGITGDHGSIVAALNWQDSPLGKAAETLGGNIHVKLEDGQLKEVQPGAGRVFGLLSLNALPRRILLNFSDVFAKGFGYDSIEGDFTVQDGDAYTQNLVMKGPAASIHLVGRTGLAKHDFDEALIVDASVGSTLPVVGALAGGVGVGAVVFLLTEIFKKPITQAGEVRYRLTGSWDNPVLTKVAEAPPSATTRKKP